MTNPELRHPSLNGPRAEPDSPPLQASARLGAWSEERPDVLGEPFVARVIGLPDDDEGPIVATLVRWAGAPVPGQTTASGTGRLAAPGTRRLAALYLHGFSDYFFQRELAAFFAGRGVAFYALDLRKCGRSLLPHQTPNDCSALSDYDAELDAAFQLILDEGHDQLVVVGHSTGGLIAPLWLARRSRLPLAGLILNSPFFEFRQPGALRAAMLPVVRRLGRRWPHRPLPMLPNARYGQSLHASRRGEWDYRLDWKPLAGVKVRLGWLRAVGDGQRQLHAGLDLKVPTLILSSTQRVSTRRWSSELYRGDAVLDPESIARWTPAVGRHTTSIRVQDAMHDVYLSTPAVRAEAYEVTATWLDAWVR